MDRFCRMSLDDFDLLLCAEGLELEEAAYPPRCKPPRGPLRIRSHDRGGVKVEVARRQLALDDFRLAVLFQTGSCIFGGSEDLARFFRGPIATAFGIECEPIPPPVALAPPADEEPAAGIEASPTPPRKRRGTRARALPPRADELAARLARDVHGQDVALAQIARVATTQLAKRRPARPESVLLVGPTGTGKTSTIEALPAALDELGCPGAHVFRIDCGELVHASDIRRVLGAPPSYIGYVEEPPLVAALRQPGCILLLDEIEKADDVVHDVFLGLLDDGRLTAPDGETIEAPGTIVALTTNLGADELRYRLRDVPPGSREEQAVCRDQLLRENWPPELVGRVGTIAVFDELSEESQRSVAEGAIRHLAEEFGLTIDELPGVLIDVVRDLADASEIGARALTYAARDLLVEAFGDAARDGVSGRVALDPGPPPRVVAAARSGSRSRHTTPS